jgi:xanthine dehydrogenase YagS FAD-binding subunit
LPDWPWLWKSNDDTVIRGRVYLSGAAPVPWRSRPVEEAVTGRHLDDATIQKAARAVVEEATPILENTYKMDLFKGVVEEELQAIR